MKDTNQTGASTANKHGLSQFTDSTTLVHPLTPECVKELVEGAKRSITALDNISEALVDSMGAAFDHGGLPELRRVTRASIAIAVQLQHKQLALEELEVELHCYFLPDYAEEDDTERVIDLWREIVQPTTAFAEYLVESFKLTY